MAEHHWTFIAVAYGVTAVAIVAELLALARRRRRALERVARERDVDDDDDGAH
jgi:heme exporter protein CcmD